MSLTVAQAQNSARSSIRLFDGHFLQRTAQLRGAGGSPRSGPSSSYYVHRRNSSFMDNTELHYWPGAINKSRSYYFSHRTSSSTNHPSSYSSVSRPDCSLYRSRSAAATGGL